MTESAPRSIEPEDSFEIKNRGTVYTFKAEPDPLFSIGEHVMMDGAEYVVRAIERFCITPAPGRPCGLLLKRVTEETLVAAHNPVLCEPNGTRTECVCPCGLCLQDRCREIKKPM